MCVGTNQRVRDRTEHCLCAPLVSLTGVVVSFLFPPIGSSSLATFKGMVTLEPAQFRISGPPLRSSSPRMRRIFGLEEAGPPIRWGDEIPSNLNEVVRRINRVRSNTCYKDHKISRVWSK